MLEGHSASSLFGDNVAWPDEKPNQPGTLLFLLGASLEDKLCVIEYPETAEYGKFIEAVKFVYARNGSLAQGCTVSSPPRLWWIDEEDKLTIHCALQKIALPATKREGLKVEWAEQLLVQNPYDPNVRVLATMADGMTVILNEVKKNVR